jgi:hypothetical protein
VVTAAVYLFIRNVASAKNYGVDVEDRFIESYATRLIAGFRSLRTQERVGPVDSKPGELGDRLVG